MDTTKTGKLIATLRKSKGLTQSALAEILGLSNKAVSKWETGEGLPDISILPELAKVLGVTVDELLKGEKGEKESVKVEEIANEKNLMNLFSICSIVSLFLCVSGALLGAFTNIYCYAHFSRVLFYTHWEIIFDALAFFAVVFGNLLFYVSAVRLNLVMEKREIMKRAHKKSLSLIVISCVFFFSFLARVANRYIQLEYTVAAVAALLGILLIISAVVASKKIERKLENGEKESNTEAD